MTHTMLVILGWSGHLALSGNTSGWSKQGLNEAGDKVMCNMSPTLCETLCATDGRFAPR